jgi:hypothetical protein
MALAPLVCGCDGRSMAAVRSGRKSHPHGYDRGMRVTLVVLGMLVILGGLVWIAQGLNLPFAPRSFMTADRAWIVAGAAGLMVGIVLVARGWRRS